MRKIFASLSTLLVLAVAAQFFLAGMGAFDSASKHEAFGPHRVLGYGILLFAVVLTLVAAAARLPGRLIGAAGLVAGLVLLQIVISEVASGIASSGGTSTAGTLVFGLHAVNAIAVGIAASRVVVRARALARPQTETSTEPGPREPGPRERTTAPSR